MKKIYVILCILPLLVTGLFSFTLFAESYSLNNIGAGTISQSSLNDFNEGDYIFSRYDNGDLKLSTGLVETWNTVGTKTNDKFGYTISSAGDLNGDGYDDIIVGAPNFFSNSGAVYVWYGSKHGLPEVTNSQDADWSVKGENTGQYFGMSVACAGDLNGDGFDDIIAGAYGYNLSSGRVYVWYGSGGGLQPLKITDPFKSAANSDWNITGVNQNDYFGYSVSGAGDVNGDGYDDVIVGAYRSNNNFIGSAFVWYGSSSGLTVGTNSSDADWSMTGEAKSYFGYKVSRAGDVNGDGFDDILVGAYYLNSEEGKAYLWYGSSKGLASGADATYADWIMKGEAKWHRFGYSLSSAGDVNGDGYDDIIISSYGFNSQTGKVYVFYGSASGFAQGTDASVANWIMEGEKPSVIFGENVAWAGDINGDGFDDIVLGSHNYWPNLYLVKGKIYMWAGSSTGLIKGTNAKDALWSSYSEFSSAGFGYVIAGAGDVNGDGYDDILTSAYKVNSNTGKVYLFSYGMRSPFSVETDWTAGGEGTSDGFGYSVDSAGDVNGDGYEDLIVGAYVDNSFTGKVYVWYGSEYGLISGKSDWSVTGSAILQYFGFSVAGAGDINGDGYDDIIVGAYYFNSGYGRAYAWFGGPNGLSTSKDSGDADWIIGGNTAGSRFGWSVAGAGDVNGDGFDDVLIGASYDKSKTGKGYLFYGRKSFLVSKDTEADWIMPGESSGNLFAGDVDSAGDLDGDGYDDVVITAYGHDSSKGKIYVWYGSSWGLNSSTKADQADWNITGENSNDYFGFVSTGTGDANGDGYDDLVASAYGYASSTGKLYAWYGSKNGLPPDPDAANAHWSVVGERPDDFLGSALSSAGDVNGDGYSDIIAGAGSYLAETGRTYVWLGSYDGFKAGKNAKDAQWIEDGENIKDFFGTGVAGTGDVNGDGYDDIIAGAYYYNSATGKTYVWYGSGFVQRGVYDSPVFNIAGTDNMDWMKLSWEPVTLPGGTAVKAQVSISNDGKDWDFIGPDGTSSSYYTQATGQRMYTGETGKYLMVRFYLESNFGFGGDAFGKLHTSRSPILGNYRIDYGIYKKPGVQLTSPNGGEDWMKGDFYPITWYATGELNGSSVSIYYSTDNGASWTTISAGMANTGYYNWTVPNVDTPSALIRVNVTDIYGNDVSDTSDASFAIDPPPGVLLSGGGNGVKNNPQFDEQPEPLVDDSDDVSRSTADGPSGDGSDGSGVHAYLVLSIVLVLSIIFNVLFVIQTKQQRKEKEAEKKSKGQRNMNKNQHGPENRNNALVKQTRIASGGFKKRI